MVSDTMISSVNGCAASAMPPAFNCIFFAPVFIHSFIAQDTTKSNHAPKSNVMRVIHVHTHTHEATEDVATNLYA